MLRMAMVAMLALTGCAYTFQEHLPVRRVPDQPVDRAACTTSRVLPAVDLGLAAAEVLVGIAGVAIHANVGHVSNHEDTGNVVARVGLFSALLQYASADTGFGWAKECREIQTTATAAR